MPEDNNNVQVPQAEAQPVANPQEQPMAEPAPQLKDDVSNGVNTPSDNSGNIQAARDAFMSMLSNTQNDTLVQSTPEPTPAPQAPPQPMMQPETIAPQIDMNDISTRIEQAVQNAISRGDMQPENPQELPPAESHEPEFPELDINSDEFYEKFANDPGSAIMDIANAQTERRMAELTQRLQPLLAQADTARENEAIMDAVRRFSENGHDDFGEYKDDMVAYLKEGNFQMNDPEAYEKAYSHAKINKLEQLNRQLSETQGRTLANYMDDDNSISEMAQNDKVKQLVINEYLKGLSNGGKPQVISNGSGISPVASPQSEIGTINDAAKLFRQQLGN